MASYVVKVQSDGSTRRLSLVGRDAIVFSYEKLQGRIRDLFRLPSTVQFELTYTDSDGDVVTMGDDQDLRDALVLQSLNPLRVSLTQIKQGTNLTNGSPVLEKQSNSDVVLEKGDKMDFPKVDLTKKWDDTSALSDKGKESTIDGETISPDLSSSDAAPANGTVTDAKETSAEDATDSKGTGDAGVAEHKGNESVHRGIKCDGCGAIPIVGPRFKSLNKQNYDLCLACFKATTEEEQTGYVKFDRQIFRRGSRGWNFYLANNARRTFAEGRTPTPDSASKESTAAAVGKVPNEAENAVLDSSRVVHQGVQCDECGIIPVEGPRYKSSVRFNYDLCHGCFEKSGGNVREYSRIDQPAACYGHPLMMRQMMRLGSPICRHGLMTGRRIWVQDPSKENVNLSGAEQKTPASATDGKMEGEVAVSGAKVETDSIQANSKQEVYIADGVADAEGEAKADKADGVADVEGEAKAVEVPATNTITEGDSGTSSGLKVPTPVDLQVESTDGSPVNSADQSSGAGAEDLQAPAAPDIDLSTREGLLAKLAVMGFTDPTLNAELLEKNNSDLRKTLDDLCAAEEWDPILGELQEMGFYDSNMNRRLMFKNNGSVKRVVKELVQLYKGGKQA